MVKEFNSNWITLVRQHVLCFIVLEVKMFSSFFPKPKAIQVVFVIRILVLVLVLLREQAVFVFINTVQNHYDRYLVSIKHGLQMCRSTWSRIIGFQ